VAENVVVHYRDGQLLKGYITAFSGENQSFEVEPLDPGGPERITVELATLKAVFFVKDFVGDSAYAEVKTFPSGAYQPGTRMEAYQPGTRMEVAMFDGEVLVGSVEGYRPDGHGFFLVPADTQSNNLRCFVVAASVKRASFFVD
jgi:hypothetical protein